MLKRHLSTAAACAALVVVFLMSFGANAFAAAQVIPDEATPALDLLRAVYEAFAGGHRVAAGALALVAAVALLKRYAGQISPRFETFLHTDTGGAATTLALSFFGAVAAATSTGALSWSVVWTSGGLAVAAVGGYTLIRRLVVDRIVASKWYATAPGWVKTMLSVVTWLGSKPPAIATAEKAGQDAVAASPSPGADGIAGPSTKF